MSQVEIIEAESGRSYFDEVEKLFREFYDEMMSLGLLTPLIPDGEKAWRMGVEKTIGRFSALYLAMAENKIVGFSVGMLRYDATFIGGKLTGFITHVYVQPEFRQSGVGGALMTCLEEWFKKQRVDSIELQVLTNNVQAVNFWKKMDYKQYLLVMRK